MTTPGRRVRHGPAEEHPTEASDAVGRVRQAAAGASSPRGAVEAAAQVLRELSGARSLGIWLRSGERVRLFGYAVAAGVGGEIEERIVRSYETVALDAELPGPQAMRRRETLHFERDSSELHLPVRMALAGLGADQLYAIPIFDGDTVVGCALIGVEGTEPLHAPLLEEVARALDWLARDHRARGVSEGED